MRRVAVWDNEPTTLREELASVREHLAIQQFRYGEKLRYEIDADESLMDLKIPKLLLQPLVENAVTHGVAMKPDGGLVKVTAKRKDGGIELSVEDDGAGMNELKREELNRAFNRAGGTGNGNIGLKNVADRVRLIYGDRAGFQIVSTENVGTRVTLTLKEITHESVNCG